MKVVNFYPMVSSFWEICKVGIGGLRILEGDIFAHLLQELPNSTNKAYILWGICKTPELKLSIFGKKLKVVMD